MRCPVPSHLCLSLSVGHFAEAYRPLRRTGPVHASGPRVGLGSEVAELEEARMHDSEHCLSLPPASGRGRVMARGSAYRYRRSDGQTDFVLRASC